MPRDRKPRSVLTLDAARRAAVNLLRVRDRSTDELHNRLVARGAPSEVAARVVAELQRARLIDDAKLARHTIANELEQGAVGRLRLEDKLARRLIDERVASPAIDEVLRDRRGADDALAVARQLLNQIAARASTGASTKAPIRDTPSRGAKRKSKPGQPLDAKVWRRIAAALARRGFEDDDIERAMDGLGLPLPSGSDRRDTL
jgi:SOS response regulatory protein OraA/RecX